MATLLRLSEVQFYVDGQPVESEVIGQDKRINVSMVNKVSVGGGGHEVGRAAYGKFMQARFGVKPFVGSIDEVFVWARALTAAEVAKMAK